MTIPRSNSRLNFSILTSRSQLVPLAIFLLAIGARIIAGARTIDDSYITFRYARNILAGNGFVYNPGEHVLGTTTPFYTILLVALATFTGGTQAPFPQIALAVNALADGLTVILLYFTGRKSGFVNAGVATALVWAIAPFSVTFAIGGLETSVFILLLTGMCFAYVNRKTMLTAALAALALLTRPDALILIGPIALDRFLQVAPIQLLARRHAKFQLTLPEFKKATLEISIFLLPVLIWIIFATSYFGSPLPHSIAAKSLAYRLPGEAAFVRLLQHYATPFLDHLTFGVSAIAVGLVLYPFLYIIGARQLLRQNPSFWPWLAYPWLYFAVFSLANPLIFRWYLSPPLPPYFLGILVGAEVLFRSFLKARKGDGSAVAGTRLPMWRNLIIGIVCVIPFILSLRDWNQHPDHGLDRPAPSMAWYRLELLYRQAADFLAPEIRSRSEAPLLAAGDVGILGFFTGARILDTVGLNSPISTNYYPLDANYYVINYAIPPDLILDTQPDFLVILEVYGRAGLLKDSRFNVAYRLLESIPTDIYGSNGMLIFERVK